MQVPGAWTKWKELEQRHRKPHTLTQKMRMEGYNAGKTQKRSHMLQLQALLGQRKPIVTTSRGVHYENIRKQRAEKYRVIYIHKRKNLEFS